MTTLLLADDDTGADLATYVGRAHRLDASAAARLQATGDRLACWVGVLPGSGLTQDGVVVGLRVLPLAEPVAAPVDTTVAVTSLLDRFARWGTARRGQRLSVPPTEVTATWSGLMPPRTGWQQVGTLDPVDVEQVAGDGIAQVATGAGTGSAALAVAQLRAAVWGRPMIEQGLPAGLAFGCFGLGFLTGEPVLVHRAGRWWRLSTRTGHVLGR